MNIKILETALSDLIQAKQFYGTHDERLGDYFVESVSADIDSLILYGGIHSKIFGLHRMLAHRFPYAIYYLIDSFDNVIIYRVLDCRQNPKKIKSRLTKL